jgi:hypothetical protein
MPDVMMADVCAAMPWFCRCWMMADVMVLYTYIQFICSSFYKFAAAAINLLSHITEVVDDT